MTIDEKKRPGRPLMSRTDINVTKICALVLEDQPWTIDEQEMLSFISWSSVQTILTEDLSMTRIAAKFMPQILTGQQKEQRVETCRALKARQRINPSFLFKVITSDESWCFGYDTETKQQKASR